MEFLYKLFPYESIFAWDGNTLTVWWVIGTIGIFIGFLYRLVTVASRLIKSVEKSIKNFSEDTIANDSQLKTIWQDYSETFLDFNGGRKTDESSYDFFNEKNLLASNTNLKLLSSIPSTLVGLGILGTFVGLTYGITYFKTTSTEQINESIELLLSGMGTAFVSSIWGMSLSLIFTVIEKRRIHSLHNSIHQLCYNLDKKYKISKEDKRQIELAGQERILSDYFIFTDENNNRVKPANVFRDIYDESVKQSKAMQAFSTDLAMKIEAGFDSILSNQIQKVIIPELHLLKTEIENLGKKLQDSTTGMSQNVVNELESALSKMMDEFKTAVSGSTKSELKEIATLLGQAGSSLIDFPAKFQEMTEKLNTDFKSLQEVIQQIAKQTLAQSNESTEQMKKQVEEMSEIFKTNVGELQIGQEVLITKQSENLQIVDKLLNTFSASIEEMNSLSINVTEMILRFNNVQNELTLTAGQLKLISENMNNSSSAFKDAQLKFSQHSNQFLENNSKTIEEIQKSLSRAKEVSSDYAMKFSIIEEGLQSIFNQIQNGLDDYRDTIGSSMETYLGKYSEALTKTAESLTGALSKQEDILDELTEQLSSLKRRD